MDADQLEVVTEKMAPKGYQFQRGKCDSIVYTCVKTGVTIPHHVDDLHVGAAHVDLEFLLSKQVLGEFLDMKVGNVEAPGTKVNVSGKAKLCTQDAFFTMPVDKHRVNIFTPRPLARQTVDSCRGKKSRTEDNTKPVDEHRAVLHPKCVRNATYLSIDQRDVRFDVKKLGRHMRDPREVGYGKISCRTKFPSQTGPCKSCHVESRK